MKFVCYKEFDDPEEPTYPGILYKDNILPLARVISVAEAFHPRGLEIPEDLNMLISLLPTYVPAVKELEKNKTIENIWPEIGVSLAAPMPKPNRILAIGRNYAEHASEMGDDIPSEPIVFQKASTAVIGPDHPIVIPDDVGRIDYEGELAVVIGKMGRNISETDAMSYIVGYTLLNDITARDQQKRDFLRGLPWFMSKSYDTFCPLGPCIITADEIRNPHALDLSVTVNGEVKQKVNTSEMIFKIPKLISYISRRITLEPGDIIATGTPPGIGPLKPGDTVDVTIDKIGTLSNPVIGEDI